MYTPLIFTIYDMWRAVKRERLNSNLVISGSVSFKLSGNNVCEHTGIFMSTKKTFKSSMASLRPSTASDIGKN